MASIYVTGLREKEDMVIGIKGVTVHAVETNLRKTMQEITDNLIRAIKENPNLQVKVSVIATLALVISLAVPGLATEDAAPLRLCDEGVVGVTSRQGQQVCGYQVEASCYYSLDAVVPLRRVEGGYVIQTSRAHADARCGGLGKDGYEFAFLAAADDEFYPLNEPLTGYAVPDGRREVPLFSSKASVAAFRRYVPPVTVAGGK